jgi:hypothetical protein
MLLPMSSATLQELSEIVATAIMAIIINVE